MKKIAIIADDIAFPGEQGLGRLYFLAGLFSRSGYEAELITGSFQHWEKRQRKLPVPCGENQSAGNSAAQVQPAAVKPVKITCLPEKSYTKNIQLKRIASYMGLTRRIIRYLKGRDYDLLYVQIPDNYMASRVAKHANKRGIPVIVDVEDLWPQAMRMVFDVPVISSVLFSPFSACAKRAYKNASAVVGSSDEYRDEPLKYGICPPEKLTCYVGNDLAYFDECARNNASSVLKPEGEFWVIYAGTLGTSYDIGTLIEAADLIKKDGCGDLSSNIENIKIKILGSGPMAEEWQALAGRISGDVQFLGYRPYAEMCAYLAASDITVNSIVKGAPQGIVSKIGDYLAAGKPMINTCMNPEFREKVSADGFGINVEPGNPEVLAKAIIQLASDPERTGEMGLKGRRIAEEQFDRNKTYLKIIELADRL